MTTLHLKKPLYVVTRPLRRRPQSKKPVAVEIKKKRELVITDATPLPHQSHKLEGMDFSAALIALKNGMRVARKGWNGKGMFLYLVPGSEFHVSRPPLLGIYDRGTLVRYHAHVDMRTAQGDCVPWLCSQTDMLAEDWALVVEPKTGEVSEEARSGAG